MLLSHQCHALASAGPLGPYLLLTHILVNILVKFNLKYKDPYQPCEWTICPFKWSWHAQNISKVTFQPLGDHNVTDGGDPNCLAGSLFGHGVFTFWWVSKYGNYHRIVVILSSEYMHKDSEEMLNYLMFRSMMMNPYLGSKKGNFVSCQELRNLRMWREEICLLCPAGLWTWHRVWPAE